MNRKVISIINTGTSNLASIIASFDRLGCVTEVINSPLATQRARALVLPGVGTFGAAVAQLKEKKIFDPVRDWIKWDRPLFAVCLGLQLLFSSSDESPDCEGLGIFNGRVSRVPFGARDTHFGWNSILSPSDQTLLGIGYFAHSFCVPSAPDGIQAYYTKYNSEFVSMIKTGSLLATQFHPEISGAFGSTVIASWLRSLKC